MNIITRILMKGRLEDQGQRRHDFRSRDESDSRKEPQAKTGKQLLESGKDTETHPSFPRASSTANSFILGLIFITKFMILIICYSSNSHRSLGIILLSIHP